MLTFLICIIACTGVQDYVLSLSESVRPFLDKVLDWDHDGVDKDLDAIARMMIDWEDKFAIRLGLRHMDIEDIKSENRDPLLQRLVHVQCGQC